MEPNNGNDGFVNDGWGPELRLYTIVRNPTTKSKVVLSHLNGVEIGPGQTVDFRTMFRKAQVIDAAHEVASLIKAGYLEDLGEGADKRSTPATGTDVGADIQKKIRDALIRDMAGSTSMSLLEDGMRHKDIEVRKAAQLQMDILLGKRDDSGQIIPGNEEEEVAKPTELIRSPSNAVPAQTAPPVAPVAPVPAQAAPAAPATQDLTSGTVAGGSSAEGVSQVPGSPVIQRQ